MRAVRDDEDGLALIEAGHDLVRDKAVHVHADEREHRRGDAEQEAGHDHEHAVEGEDHAAHAERIIFLQDGAQDVESARASIHAEHEAIADAVEHAAEDRRQHHIVKRRAGIERPQDVQAEGEDPRADDHIDRVLPAHELQRGQQQRQIVKKRLQADGQMEEIIKDDGDAGRAAGEQMRGHQEEIDARARDEAADGDADVSLHGMLPGKISHGAQPSSSSPNGSAVRRKAERLPSLPSSTRIRCQSGCAGCGYA